MDELIKILKEIGADNEGNVLWFPEILTQKEINLNGYTRQESACPSIPHEYGEQTAGACGDDFSGTMIYPFKDMFIKVRFNC